LPLARASIFSVIVIDKLLHLAEDPERLTD
jgi:hypothetical protein